MQLVVKSQNVYIIYYIINRMVKGTRKATKRLTKVASKKVRRNPFTTRNLQAALMNIHRNVEVASRIINKKITVVPVKRNALGRQAKSRFLQTIKTNRNIKEQIKQQRQQLKHNVDDITSMMSKL